MLLRVKPYLRIAFIHGYYRTLRFFMRKKWQRMYIDYMERFRFSDTYKSLHRQIIEKIKEDRPDIMKSWIRRNYIVLRISMLATFIGEEPDSYWGLDYPGSTLRQRLSTITGARLNFGNRIFNDPQKIYLLNDKCAFAEHWENFFSRRYCCIKTISETDFSKLFHNTEKLVVKPIDGMRGEEFHIIETDGDPATIYRILSAKNENCIVEEYIAQSGILHNLNPSSLNTIRVITLRIDGKIIPASAYLRIGGSGEYTDNFHNGGVEVVIRMSDGKLLDGMTFTRNHLTKHPQTGVRFSGIMVPRWQEVLDFCIKAHSIAPDGLDRIGWDVCVDESHLLMIEGNGCPGFGPYRRENPDCWKLFKMIFNNWEEEQKKNEDV